MKDHKGNCRTSDGKPMKQLELRETSMAATEDREQENMARKRGNKQTFNYWEA